MVSASESGRLRAGVVGAGHMGQYHILALAELWDVDLEAAKELFRVARQEQRVLHVGHVERFNGAVQELRKIVEQPILIESRRLGPFVQRVQNDSMVMA